jgi:hypothetical protein
MNQHHSDSNYFERRASEERAAAECARDPRARQSHSDLAERYAHAAQADVMEREDDGPEAMVAAGALLQPEFRILP